MKERFLELRRKIIEKDFSRMNDKQREAVFTIKGPLLILAGAGSGKTTVLVNRIANIVKYGDAYNSDYVYRDVTESDIVMLEAYYKGEIPLNREISWLTAVYPAKPWNILAITFTNKAAGELKDRLTAFLGEEDGNAIWAGTFHSVCSRILRVYGDRIGYTSHFTIYDTDDSKRVMKECERILKIDKNVLPPKEILSAISDAKNRLLTPEEYRSQAGNDIRKLKIAEAYKLYQRLLKEADAMDFDDMIMNTVTLLEKDREVREYYQDKFMYVHVDEYQDTNYAQYVLTSLFAGKWQNICVVGDDDQSIYRFRGATIENIMNFEDNYKNAKIIRLEQNYRSTGNILNAANGVIRNNTSRKGKKLWTAGEDGEKLSVFTAENETYEVMFVADEIMKNVENGRKFSDHAVLYRTNAQSQSVERAFVRMGIPYRIIGGKRFYERKEVRDAIAYLTVINNPSDNVKLRRIINEPKRGIGDTTINYASDIAATIGTSVYDVIEHAGEYEKLARSANKLNKFTGLMDRLRSESAKMSMPDFFELLLSETGYMEYIEKDKTTYEERYSNLQELKSNISRYLEENEEGNLSGFLEEVSLLSDIDSYNEQTDVSVLMTLHSAKGLEFPIVFMVGMEEGIFPGRRSMFDEEEVEEERRLAYVGITRAREKLYLTNAATRMLYGSTNRNPVSRFLEEIPAEYREETGSESIYAAEVKHGELGGFGSHAGFSGGYTGGFKGERSRSESRGFTVNTGAPRRETPVSDETYSVGDTVKHRAFGTGVIISVTPMANDSLLEIAFDKAGTKKIMANYAKLEKLN